MPVEQGNSIGSGVVESTENALATFENAQSETPKAKLEQLRESAARRIDDEPGLFDPDKRPSGLDDIESTARALGETSESFSNATLFLAIDQGDTAITSETFYGESARDPIIGLTYSIEKRMGVDLADPESTDLVSGEKLDRIRHRTEQRLWEEVIEGNFEDRKTSHQLHHTERKLMYDTVTGEGETRSTESGIKPEGEWQEVIEATQQIYTARALLGEKIDTIKQPISENASPEDLVDMAILTQFVQVLNLQIADSMARMDTIAETLKGIGDITESLADKHLQARNADRAEWNQPPLTTLDSQSSQELLADQSQLPFGRTLRINTNGEMVIIENDTAINPPSGTENVFRLREMHTRMREGVGKTDSFEPEDHIKPPANNRGDNQDGNSETQRGHTNLRGAQPASSRASQPAGITHGR